MKESSEYFVPSRLEDPFLNTGEEKQEKPSAEKDGFLTKETVQSVGVMEDIARARIELEKNILGGSFSFSQWLDIWEEKIKPAYPSIRPYERFFRDAIQVAVMVHWSVRNLYQDTRAQIRNSLKKNTTASDVETEHLVSKRLEGSLFKKIFGKYPK